MQSILSFLHTDVLSLPNVFFKPNYSIHFNYTCSHVTSFFQFIIIIIILGISFMQDIYTYIPEKNHVPRDTLCCNYSDVTIDGAYIASS